ncbi:MAG: NAD(P)-binding domain-containing protein [Acidobacteria bacterium]|nr:NAD(P)-binding domain-containing protein [Acidobacteriota bacterium]
MTSQRIGLIGLGLLGTALARRLIGAGQPVFGFDVSALTAARLCYPWEGNAARTPARWLPHAAAPS